VLKKSWTYKDQLNPIAEYDANGVLEYLFLYGEKSHVPEYIYNAKTTGKYKIVTDQVGSVRLIVQSGGKRGAYQRIDYDSFGRVLNDTWPGFQPFGFAGGLYDPDTGLVRFGARDYDPEIGRWLTKDPIRFDGGINLYAYVNNDPVNYIDPTGLRSRILNRLFRPIFCLVGLALLSPEIPPARDKCQCEFNKAMESGNPESFLTGGRSGGKGQGDASFKHCVCKEAGGAPSLGIDNLCQFVLDNCPRSIPLFPFGAPFPVPS